MIENFGRDRKRLGIATETVSRGGPMNALYAAAILCLVTSGVARAESLVVVEARGIASTAGTLIDSASHLTLRQGEHVRLISENGNQYCLDGPYDGPAKPRHAPSPGARWNLLETGERDQADPLTDCIQ